MLDLIVQRVRLAVDRLYVPSKQRQFSTGGARVYHDYLTDRTNSTPWRGSKSLQALEVARHDLVGAAQSGRETDERPALY